MFAFQMSQLKRHDTQCFVSNDRSAIIKYARINPSGRCTSRIWLLLLLLLYFSSTAYNSNTQTASNFQYDLVFISHFSNERCLLFYSLRTFVLVIALRTSFVFAVSPRPYLRVSVFLSLCFTVYLY